MVLKILLQPLFLTIFGSAILFLHSTQLATAQGKPDLEVKVQAASDIARGGEAFRYTITLTNIGTAKAVDVVLNVDQDQSASYLNTVSSLSTKGSCRTHKVHYRERLGCNLGDLGPGESARIEVDGKIEEFGDISVEGDAPLGSVPAYTGPVNTRSFSDDSSSQSTRQAVPQDQHTDLAKARVYSENPEENTDNNETSIKANLRPSRNIPPRVEIVSPKSEVVITRPAKRITPVVFTIKAYDPDGTIEKVNVSTQQFKISVEYPENRYFIAGKFYSIKEVEENMASFQKYFGGDAKRIGKDTYTFTLENPQYGVNQIFIHVFDNGRRSAGTSVRFTVKGDISIDWIQPGQNSVIAPGTNVILSTRTKLNEGPIKNIQLVTQRLCCGELPQMRFISKKGIYYEHKYVWKNIEKGYYSFSIYLEEESGAFTYSDSVSFKVTERPVVKITSLKNGQVFKLGQNIPIEIVAEDQDGEVKDVVVPVDGKYDRGFTWNTAGFKKSGYIYQLGKGVHIVQAKAIDDLDVESLSDPITIIVK